MCQYSGKEDDVLRTTKNPLPSDTLLMRMKDLVRIRDQTYGFNVMMNMPEKGKVPAVSSVIEHFFSYLYNLVL